MRLPFRADIEGLRAVAILLVVCAHADVPWLAGGFIGVDVFFVLSGYLITGLLLREFEAAGSIDLGSFYARRLQRLLPGLLLVVTCTALAAGVLLSPFEQIAQSRAAAAAATWTSNLYFAFSSLDYFGPAAETNLFLHTWSLGVEEQFYLLWPAWILFLLGAWKWQGQLADRERLLVGMFATAVLSVTLCLFLTTSKPELAFYMVYSRGWQFALGALVFLLQSRWQPGVLLTLSGWAGLTTLIATSLIIDAQTPYPGTWSLLPAIGTALILAAGTHTQDLPAVGGLLSVRPMQAIGRVSYAWYLWHWPVFLLGATVLDGSNPIYRFGLAAVSLVLAAISHRLVESPIRYSTRLRARPRTVLGLGLVSMIAMLVAMQFWTHVARIWAATPEQQRYAAVRNDIPVIYGMGCDEWFHTSRVKVCSFGEADAPHTVVLMGDSFAGQWFPAVEGAFDRPGWRLLVITKSSCPMVDAPFFYTRIGREYVECASWRDAAIDFLASLQPDLVLLSSVPSYPYTSDEWERGTVPILQGLANASGRVGVIMPTPLLPFDGPACLARAQWRERWLPSQPAACSSPDSDRHAAVTAALSKAIDAVPAARTIHLSNYVCPDGHCAAERDGVIVYRDHQHLTASFTASMAQVLEDNLARQDWLGTQGASAPARTLGESPTEPAPTD